MITHLCSQDEWTSAQKAGSYRPASLETEGFIHCSTPEQVLRVANAFYTWVPGLVLLWIDPEKLRAELRWEPPTMSSDPHAGELFPHIYGPLNLDAVVGAPPFLAGLDGQFRDVPRPRK
jgi:uncharacterized protein (DUF952 family)